MINITDYNLVKTAFSSLMGITEDEAEDYKSNIESVIESVSDKLADSQYENNSAVVYYCAVKAFYRQVLLENTQSGITSFSAGDVSYTKGTTSEENARLLLETALAECGGVINEGSFAFKVV
ncbi:MAG: hypothetical protein LIO62_03890 [Clostridiales bacterium]|nr:hypothetical protein [Clostridiales bacterium]